MGPSPSSMCGYHSPACRAIISRGSSLEAGGARPVMMPIPLILCPLTLLILRVGGNGQAKFFLPLWSAWQSDRHRRPRCPAHLAEAECHEGVPMLVADGRMVLPPSRVAGRLAACDIGPPASVGLDQPLGAQLLQGLAHRAN